jgi:CheY-like chemotaxis protein
MNKQSVKNVLIVEDDMLLSLVEERLVEKMGHEVVAKVGNGRDAIDKARELNPDIILMDIVLKGDIDGIQAMEEIRKHSNVPVVYLSGNSDRFNYERAKKTGFVDYLVKPINSNDLYKPFEKAFINKDGSGKDSSEISKKEQRLNKTA